MDYLLNLIDHMSAPGIIVSITAFLVGIKFPDWDFKMGLKHRSLLTHSPLVLLIFFKLYERDKSSSFRYFIMGFALALALHFIFDIFPKGWSGGALLKVPGLNLSLKPMISKSLLFLFIAYSLFEGIKYTRSLTEFFYLFFVGCICLLQNMKKEEKFFRPFFTFGILLFLLGSLKYKEIYKTVEKTSINVIKISKKYYYEIKK